MSELNCESCLDAQNIKQGKADDFSLILQPIAQLLLKKNADYGDSFKLLREKYGPVGFYVRIADKLNRIEQVDKNGNQVNESAIDTLKDIIGYCTLEIRYRQNKGFKPKGECLSKTGTIKP